MVRDSTLNFSVLNRTCKLVVLLCIIHISVTFIFYVRSLDIRSAFVQKQQTHPTRLEEAAASRARAAEAVAEAPGGRNGTAATSSTDLRPLEKCPETSPLLGESGLL